MTNVLHIYTRVSTLVQETEGTSLRTQEELGIQKAKELGFEYRLWNEGGQSSRYEDLDNRPVLRKLLLEVEDSKVENLFVFNTDRLSRNQKTWGGIRWKLKQNRVRLYTPSGVIDLTSPMDDLIIGILSEISSYDNALRSERSQLGKLQKVKNGFWMGGPPPYGYAIKDGILVEDPDESHWVKWIYSAYLDGMPIRKIKAELDENDISTRHKKGGWSLGSLQKVLRNTFYIGFYMYSDKKLAETIKCECPAFLPETIWNRAQQKRKETLQRKGQFNKTKHFYMLRDFMYCGHCGRPIAGRKNLGKREELYYCPDKERNWAIKPPNDNEKWVRGRGCNMIKSLNIPRTDAIVFNTVINTLKDPSDLHKQLADKLGVDQGYRQRRAHIRKNITALEKQLDTIETSLADLETDVRTNKIDTVICERVKTNLTCQREDLLEKIEQASIRYERLDHDVQWLSALSNLTLDTARFERNFSDRTTVE
ncbi:recombinase family protein [Terasakiella sp.]|uniref:recombinase family protein n=1 Tax=Terasakiella sp. TaxID=2034861 RepID=UPI003AA93BE1